jgi:hypothetical protein
VKASLVTGGCPGFAIRKCLHCKKPWISSGSELCVITNQYCPHCIPLIMETLPDWKLNPDRKPAEERILARLELLRRKKANSVAAQRQLIRERRRSA